MIAEKPLHLPNIQGSVDVSNFKNSGTGPVLKVPVASPLKLIEKPLKNHRTFNIEDTHITPASTPPMKYEPRRSPKVETVILLASPKVTPLKAIERNSSPVKARSRRSHTDPELMLHSETVGTNIRLPKLEHPDNFASFPEVRIDSFSPTKTRTLNRIDGIVIAPKASPLKVMERSRSLLMWTDEDLKQKGPRKLTSSFDNFGGDYGKPPALERSVSYRLPEPGEVEMVWDYQLKTFVPVARRK